MRRGVTAVEVLFAVGLIALALIPVMTLSQSQERDTYLLEYHTLAQNRARSLVDWLVALDPVAVEQDLAKQGVAPVTADDLTLRMLPADRLPKESAVLEYAVRGKDAASARLKLFRAELGVGALSGVTAVRARVFFAFPGDRAGLERNYTLTRLVGRPAVGHSLLPAWP